MFFSISREPRSNFSHCYNLGPFVVNTDAGWKQYNDNGIKCLYKGYADSGDLDTLLNIILQERIPTLGGNFCVIVYDSSGQKLQIKTDKLRSFPIYYTNDVEITNLRSLTSQTWVDDLIEVGEDFSIISLKYDAIGDIIPNSITYNELIEFVDSRLSEKIQDFIKFNKLPIKVYLSGGVDTTLVYSYLQKYTNNFELIRYNLTEYDRFWLQNHNEFTKYWAYKQIHHWVDPCVLMSGAPGDEFMLRSPCYGDLFLKYHGIKLSDLLNKKTWMHSYHFNKPKNQSMYKNQTMDTSISKKDMHWELCNMAANDYQHWHLGHTLTWTPLRDLEIYKMFLRLDTELAIDQILNSKVSIDLIEKNCPGLSKIICEQKNSGIYTEQYVDFLSNSKD